MKLLIDIGNTMLKCGVSDDKNVRLLFRVSSKNIEEEFLKELEKHIKIDEIENVTIASVVPDALAKVKSLIKDKKVVVISSLMDSNVKIKIDDPKELGTDLLSDLAAAKDKYGNDLLIVDLGTASKFLYLNSEGEFSSCAITPGIKMSLNMMFNNTALLPDIELSEVKNLLDCHNTKDVLSSSAYYSHIAMVNGIVKRYLKEINHPVTIIVTGGNSFLLKEKLDFEYILDENLCLYGIKVIRDLMEANHEKN